MKKFNRREILSLSAAAIVSGPMLALTSQLANASEAPQVDPDGAQAKALSYTHTSAKPEQNCMNCQLYADADAAWGPCAIFPGKQVAGAGWCSAWVKRAG